jgi:hypothetical protein
MKYHIVLSVAGLLFLSACAVQHTKTMSKSTPPVCTLSPEELKQRRQALIPGLIKQADQVTNLSNGLRLRFENKAGLLTDIARVIEQERDCCSFLHFQLAVEPSGGPITFEVTGPAGTRQMLRAL